MKNNNTSSARWWRTSRALRGALFGTALALFGVKSTAQVASYSFAQSAGTYTPITGGTVLATPTANTFGGSVDDVNFTVNFAPFSFTFNGVAYTTCNVNSNGYLTFGATTPAAGSPYTPISNAVAYAGAVSAFGGDMNGMFNLGGFTSQLRWEVVGASPNRELVVQWADWRPGFTTSTTLVSRINFQIRLAENGNIVRVVYGPSGIVLGSPTTSGTRQVGLRGASNADFNHRNSGTGVNYGSSTAATLNSESQAFNVVTTPPGLPANGLTYTWTPPPPTDLSAISVVQTVPGCLDAAEGLSARVRNTGSATLDFAVNPVSVSAAVTGAGSGTLTGALSSGTLAPGAFLNVPLTPALNMSGAGTYSFALTATLTGDLVPTNDNSSNDLVQTIATATPPLNVGFTAWNGADLSTLFPGWREATGAVLPGTGTTSAWTQTSPAAETAFGSRTASINLFDLGKNEWLLSPRTVALGANHIFRFKAAITGFNVATAFAGNMAGTDDKVIVRISNDCGATYTDLLTFDATTSGTLTNLLTEQVVSLSAYAGQEVIIGLFATEGTVNNTQDYDFHVDDLYIGPAPVTVDLSAVSVIQTAPGCFDASEILSGRVSNSGTNTLDFSVNPATLTVNVTGATTATLTATVNSGTLAPGAFLNVALSPALDMSASGTYTLGLSVALVGDLQPLNDGSSNNLVKAPGITLPQTVNFTAWTGTDLTTLFPNWREATGASVPGVGSTSAWRQTPALAETAFGTRTATINLFTTGKNDWLLSSRTVALGATDIFSFKAAITDFADSVAFPGNMAGTDDKVIVRISTDCGQTYTDLLTFDATTSATLTNSLVEQVVDLSAFAGQEVIIGIFATEGTVDDGPDYDFHVDDLYIGPAPTCAVPTALTLNSVSQTSVSASWTAAAPPDVVDYTWEIRTDLLPGTGGAIETNSTAGLTMSSGVALTPNTNYNFFVRTNCTSSQSLWAGPLPFFTGYCTAGSTVSTTVMNAFSTTGGSTNITNTGSGYSPGGYGNFTAQQVIAEAGDVINFTSDSQDPTDPTVGLAIWVDWDNDLQFETSERVFTTTGFVADPSGSFTVPALQPAGSFRMRVKMDWNNFNITAPCGTFARGEVEDYTVVVCGTITATIQENPNCAADEFSLEFTAASVGTGTVSYSVDGGAAQTAPFTGVGTIIGAFGDSSNVAVTLISGGCSTFIGNFGSSCPIGLDCNAPALSYAHCYQNGDTRTWTFENPGGTVAIKFQSGEMDPNDQVEFWEGEEGTTAHGTTPTATNTLTGLLVTSVGPTLSMSIATDGSTSCADGGSGLTAGWAFQARCGGCVEPVGEVTVDSGSGPEIDCVGEDFTAYVAMIDLGIDGTTGLPPATFGYELYVNNVLTSTVTGLDLSGGIYFPLGTYPLGTLIDVVLLHGGVAQTVCNVQIANDFTVPLSACPPDNDECVNAQVITLEPNNNCVGITGKTIGANQSGANPSCAAGAVQDVWYSINTTGFGFPQLRITDGTATTVGVEVFSACGTAVTPAACIADVTAAVNGVTFNLAEGAYLLRVFTTVAGAGTFNICLGYQPESCALAFTLPPVAANEGACVQTTITSGAAQNGPNASCSGTTGLVPDDDVWYSFVAPSNGNKLVLTTAGLSSTDWVMEVWDGCAGGPIKCSDDVNGLMPEIEICQFEYTAGQTYFVRLWTWAAGGSGNTCNLCIYEDTPCPVPPANDLCTNAQSLTLGALGSCPAASVSGTTLAATTSTGNGSPSCDLFATHNDVWYTFTTGAIAGTVRVSLTDATPINSVAIYSGFTCGAGGTQIFCNFGNATNAVVQVTPNTTYFVRVWAEIGETGPFTLCIENGPPPPPNDDCVNATPIACGQTISGTTIGGSASDNPNVTCGTTASASAGVWYTVQGFDGPMIASLCGGAGGTDTKIQVFTGSCGAFTCVDGDDDDCPLTAESIVNWTGTSGTTYYIYVYAFSTTVTFNFDLTVGCGSLGVACTENPVTLEFQTDANSVTQTTFEVLTANGAVTILSGSPAANNSITTQAICLPDGCYRLRVLDSAGDGMTTGGYELRTSGSNERIIDNTNNFTTGSTSAIASGGTFCLPIGSDKLIFSSCDKLDWVNNKFIVASANPTVSAQFGVTNTTSGYEFWFFDPNGTYSYRRFRSHATSDGFGTGATRACHFKVNGWVNSVATPHLPANVLLNVRLRGRVAGNNLEFGPACQFKIDPVLAACPRVSLQDDPANTSDFSCGVSRNFGGSGSALNRIYAKPPQPVPAVASSNVRYQFRFRIPGESICIVRPPQTSAQMTLNWSATSGPQLQCSKTYEVDVRVSLNGGASWCFGPAGTSEAAACADTEEWGKVCLVTINPCASANGGSNSMVVEGNNTFTMYPNPNRGDQLFLSVTNVEEEVSTVSVDIFDMTGKRVMARTIAVQDGFVNTNLELNGDLAGGLYMVNITAGTKAYTERLVIQP